jgi:hypothetical protein
VLYSLPIGNGAQRGNSMIIIGILYLLCALLLALYGFNTFVQRSQVASITG